MRIVRGNTPRVKFRERSPSARLFRTRQPMELLWGKTNSRRIGSARRSGSRALRPRQRGTASTRPHNLKSSHQRTARVRCSTRTDYRKIQPALGPRAQVPLSQPLSRHFCKRYAALGIAPVSQLGLTVAENVQVHAASFFGAPCDCSPAFTSVHSLSHMRVIPISSNFCFSFSRHWNHGNVGR